MASNLDRDAAHRPLESFSDRGRALGLSDDDVVEVLCATLKERWLRAGPRFIGLLHPVGEDESSRMIVEALEAFAATRRPPSSPS